MSFSSFSTVSKPQQKYLKSASEGPAELIRLETWNDNGYNRHSWSVLSY